MRLIAWLLVAGLSVFMVGAARWRIEYQHAPEIALPVMHADRRRLRWIHWWMISGVFLTVAGLGGLAWVVSDPGVAIASAAYIVGATLWVFALLFRESVGVWAASQTVETGSVPAIYPPLAEWMSLGHATHMMSAYLTAVPLGWSLAGAGLIPGWLGWAGAIWGLTMGAILLVPSIRYAAQPPLWAHVFTFSVGLALLL